MARTNPVSSYILSRTNFLSVSLDPRSKTIPIIGTARSNLLSEFCRLDHERHCEPIIAATLGWPYTTLTLFLSILTEIVHYTAFVSHVATPLRGIHVLRSLPISMDAAG